MNARTRRRPQGFTLLELTVYGVLLGVMTTALYLLLRTTLMFVLVSQNTADLQASAQKTAAVIGNEISLAHEGTSYLSVGSGYIIFLSPRDDTGHITWDNFGNTFWRRWVCYYYDSANGNLRRAEIPFTATTSAPTCTYTLSTFLAQSGSGQLIAEKMPIAGLTASVNSAGNIVTFTAKFAASVRTASDYTLQVVDQIYLRN